jgi:hypothetical protein
MAAPSGYSLAVLLDERRLQAITGTPLEGKLTNMFGGAVKALILKVPPEKSKKILVEFPSSRIDARGFLEELPVAFKRALFDEIVHSKSIGSEVIDAVMGRIEEIKAAAANEEDYLPPPDI